MKTALQELIEEIKLSKDRGETIVDYDLFCEEFLRKEESQIIDASIKANLRYSDVSNDYLVCLYTKEAKEYYNKTYKNSAA